MKNLILAILTYLILGIILNLQAQDASTILSRSKTSYGEAWKKIKFIKLHHIGHTHWLEQSESPDGPFVTSYEDITEVRSVTEAKLYQEIESKMFQSKVPSKSTWVINNGSGFMKYGTREFPMAHPFVLQQEQWHQYDPVLLLAMAEKSNAKLVNSQDLDGVAHYRMSFNVGEITYQLFINKNTFLISEAHIDTSLPYDFFYSLWGKFTTRIQYTLYSLHKENIIYPMQWDVYRTGQLWKKITINDVEFMETAPNSLFAIPEKIQKNKASSRKVSESVLSVDQTIEVAKGIFVIPGSWFSGWVEQEDGILIIEAPISSGYSVQLLDEIKKRYPSKSIKGVVVSSDAWPHLAGVREYFSLKTPVYTNILNKEILDRVAASDHSLNVDQYHANRNKPIYKLISDVIDISDKKNPIKILPINGEAGERMVAVYFPNQKVLYASDLIQRMGEGEFFFVEYLAEVRNLVRKHNLQVDTVYAMHTKPIAWKEVEEALNKIQKP